MTPLVITGWEQTVAQRVSVLCDMDKISFNRIQSFQPTSETVAQTATIM